MGVVTRTILFSILLVLFCIGLTISIHYLEAPWDYASLEEQIGDRDLAAKDYGGALMWYRDAARSNNATALYRLGSMYGKGLGVGRDDVESYKWYKRSISGSWAPAHRDFRNRVEADMAAVEHRMTARQIADADTRAERWKPRAGAPL